MPGRVVIQGQLFVFAVETVAATPDRPTRWKFLQIQAAVVAEGLGFVPGLECLQGCVGQCRLLPRYVQAADGFRQNRYADIKLDINSDGFQCCFSRL